MKEKVKAIRGSKSRPEDVKLWLINHGAKNVDKFTCANEDCIYIVLENGDVEYFSNTKYFFIFDIEELPLWRAPINCLYWCLSSNLDVYHTVETATDTDDLRYNTGNYFKSLEEATAYRQSVINLLKNRK